MSELPILRGRRLPLVASVGALVIGLTAAGMLSSRAAERHAADSRQTLAAEAGAPALMVSTRSDRGSAKPLAGATVSGRVYVTAVGGTDVTAVAFRLDSPLGEAQRVEKESPFDFAGGAADGSAQALDTSTLANGTHAVLAGFSYRDGTETGVYARFTVANQSGGPTTPPTSQPTTPPTTTPPTKPPTTTPTSPPTTSPTQSPTRPPTSPPAGRKCPGYPAPGCTGVPAGVALKTHQGSFTADRPGQVVDGLKITGKLYVAAHDVVIRNSEIHGGVLGYRQGTDYRFTVTDTLVGAPSGCNGEVAVGSAQYTATRVHIRNFGDGFRDSGNNILIQDSYVKLCSNPGDHSDGIQGYYGGSNVVIRHNTIDQRAARDVTSPLFIADGSKGVVAEDNLLAGGGYTVRLHGSGFTFKGNKVVQRSWVYGPVNSDCGGVQWADNQLVTIDTEYRVTSVAGKLNC